MLEEQLSFDDLKSLENSGALVIAGNMLNNNAVASAKIHLQLNDLSRKDNERG